MRWILPLLLAIPGAAFGQAAWDAAIIAKVAHSMVRLHDGTGKNERLMPTAPFRNLIIARDRLSAVTGQAPEIFVVDDNRFNAFVGPKLGANRIGFTLGLLRAVGNDVELLAAVMAHEMGHIAQSHIVAGAVRDSILETLAEVAGMALEARTGTPIGGVVGGLASSAAARVASLAFDRSQEHEADSYSVRALRAAGFNPEAVERMLQKLTMTRPEWLSTHPAPESRLENVRRELAMPAPLAAPTARIPDQSMSSGSP